MFILTWLLFQMLTLVVNFVGNLFLVIWAMSLIVCLWFLYVTWLLSRVYMKCMSYAYKFNYSYSVHKYRGRQIYKVVKILDYSNSFRKFLFISIPYIHDVIFCNVYKLDCLGLVSLGMFRKAVKFKHNSNSNVDFDSDDDNCSSD